MGECWKNRKVESSNSGIGRNEKGLGDVLDEKQKAERRDVMLSERACRRGPEKSYGLYRGAETGRKNRLCAGVSVKKEQKLYLWDWTAVSDPSARFENLVSCQLLKYCHLVEDSEGYGMDLRFLRDTDAREVDFVVLKEGRPLFAVECKIGEKDISPALF
jgi:hypothetical protein